MAKKFNITATCKPEQHYMVDIHDRLMQIKKLVDDGQYFAINRARQYGKTTTLTGYMLSFNFNKNKQVGVKTIQLGDKLLIEAVV